METQFHFKSETILKSKGYFKIKYGKISFLKKLYFLLEFHNLKEDSL